MSGDFQKIFREIWGLRADFCYIEKEAEGEQGK